MQRRKFIQVSAVGTTVIALTGISCKNQHSAFYNILDKPGQLSSICDLNTIREIGMAYRLQTPSESGADKLADLLSADSVGKTISSSSDDFIIQNLINQKIKQDFKAGNTVIVKGWVLTVTEARQCALLYAINQ
ncbi:MAG TPA: hypothetical protein VGZ90_12770 [Puia sp.]|jgi:hypothetical protein|nr:hypothetical protein [Puia sp.]